LFLNRCNASSQATRGEGKKSARGVDFPHQLFTLHKCTKAATGGCREITARGSKIRDRGKRRGYTEVSLYRVYRKEAAVMLKKRKLTKKGGGPEISDRLVGLVPLRYC